MAVASPLAATIPGAAAAAWPYLRAGEARPRAAAWTAAGGIPGTIIGALLSPAVGGSKLLVASGVVLVLIGRRALSPLREEAVDRGTNRTQSVNVVPTSGLSEPQIASIIAEAEAVAGEDIIRRELAELRNEAEALLYTAERALEEFGKLLPDVERVRVGEDLAACKHMNEHGTADELRQAMAQLEASAQRIGELVYSGQGPGSGSGEETAGS